MRTSTMALGFFLVFLGIQLNVVERYVMTPRMANFISADGDLASTFRGPLDNREGVNTAYESPYYQASYQPPTTVPAFSPISAISREIRLPRWLCWPVLFLGAVILINGITLRRS